jgi:hypothetical protein
LFVEGARCAFYVGAVVNNKQGGCLMKNSQPMSQNAKRVLLLAPAVVAVAAMAMNVQGNAEPVSAYVPPAAEPMAAAAAPAPVYAAYSNTAVADPVLTSVIEDEEALRRAIAAEEEQMEWEAQENARAAAARAEIEAERVRLELQILGGDPGAVPAMQTSSDAGGGPSNIEFCNNSGVDVRVAMVRSNGAFAALTRDSYIADGFYTLAPSECTFRKFGWLGGLANGYVSIFKKEGDRWVAFRTEDDGESDGATFRAHERFICWPDSAAAVDPDYSCPDSQKNIAFTHWFGTSGNVYKFRITITDTAIEKFARYRS